MQLFATVFQKHRDRTVLAVLIGLSLFLLFLPQPVRLDIARRTLNALFVPVERWTNYAADYRSLHNENRRLRRAVATLSLEREQLLQYRDERERLRNLAAFKEDQSFQLVSAEVIGRNLDRFQNVLVIDRGEADSVRVKMPVFSYEGLAGRVMKVYPNSSWVQLLCSKSSSVSCIDRRSRVVGILEWRGRNTFDLTSVSVVEDVAVGDTLVTSGFGGLIPKGFPVAVVTRVAPASDGLSLRVEARGQVNFLALEEVFVLTQRIPWDRSLFYSAADTMMIREILKDKK